MRLLLDLQCVQSTSAVRGIGRYALSLSRALVMTAGAGDRVEVLLNGGDDRDRLLRAHTALETFLPARAIHVFDAPWPWHHPPSALRRRDAEAARTAAIESLRPDVLLVGSLFEGDKENVLSVERDGVPTAALLYDLIPAADPRTYLLGPGADSYWRRYDEMQRVDLLLSISAYSGQQARDLLGEQCPPVTPVWGGPYPSGLFDAFEVRPTGVVPEVPERYLLAVGGDHPRKNLDRLIQAWAQVPATSRAGTPLVIACRLNVGTLRRLRRLAARSGLQPDELVLTGEVTEDALAELYRGALAFVFPSTEEGLGLPPLEAMAAGCPTVLARGSSLSELVEEPDAYFDGCDVTDMARVVRRVVDEPALRDHLREVAAATASRFTWERAAQLAWEALRDLDGCRPRPSVAVPELGTIDSLLQDPRPLLLPEVPTLPPPAPEVLAAELALEVRSPLPPGLRTALAPAPVLVVPEQQTARALVEAGLLDQAVLESADLLPKAVEHDVCSALRSRVPGSPWPEDLVRAMSWPPRWFLQRPWPVWLLLSAVEQPADALRAAARDRGATLVVGGSNAAVLARSADRVLVDAALLPALEADLQRARCMGAEIVVFGEREPPSWAASAPDVLSCLQSGPLVRTTGWPWAPPGD